jgi:hypothetical protein
LKKVEKKGDVGLQRRKEGKGVFDGASKMAPDVRGKTSTQEYTYV